jgi:hypothetical protein
MAIAPAKKIFSTTEEEKNLTVELERPHFLSISLTSRAFNIYSPQAKFRYFGVSLVDAGPASSFFES